MCGTRDAATIDIATFPLAPVGLTEGFAAGFFRQRSAYSYRLVPDGLDGNELAIASVSSLVSVSLLGGVPGPLLFDKFEHFTSLRSYEEAKNLTMGRTRSALDVDNGILDFRGLEFVFKVQACSCNDLLRGEVQGDDLIHMANTWLGPGDRADRIVECRIGRSADQQSLAFAREKNRHQREYTTNHDRARAINSRIVQCDGQCDCAGCDDDASQGRTVLQQNDKS